MVNLPINPNYTISKLPHSGRGCIASHDILPNSIIHLSHPLSFTILRDFKKECCAWCLKYTGENWKCKLESKWLQQVTTTPENDNDPNNSSCSAASSKFFNGGMWFCSLECLNMFKEYDYKGIITRSYDALEYVYSKSHKRPRSIEDEIEESRKDDLIIKKNKDALLDNVNLYINSKWDEINTWQQNVIGNNTNLKSRLKKINKALEKLLSHDQLVDEEITYAKFVVGVLYQRYISKSQSQTATNKTNLNIIDMGELMGFASLQSTEVEYFQHFPTLLKSHLKIYQILILTLPECLRDLLTIECYRFLVGVHSSNAFGIWELSNQVNDKVNSTANDRSKNGINITSEREYLGFSLYPTSSFFNHSCAPNLSKQRNGQVLTFTTTRHIKKREELCINYGGFQDLKVKERRKKLEDEWFFKCGCEKCEKDVKNLTQSCGTVSTAANCKGVTNVPEITVETIKGLN